MSTVAEVRLWGRTIGAVLLSEGARVAQFEYDAAFCQSGIEPAPLQMPLSRRVHMFPALPAESFHGLPGLLADSLPDHFGTEVVNAWLASQGRSAGSMNAVERLCYTGPRGMGALEYRPVLGPQEGGSRPVDVAELVELAVAVLDERTAFAGSYSDPGQAEALAQILRVSTSAGGARAKAVIAWNPETREVRSGQVEVDPGFEHWLLKFDGVAGARPGDLATPLGFGAIEFAYAQMAGAAGIEMARCRLLEENGRRHFMTRRFDRTDAGTKLHMLSLGAMAHFDYRLAGGHAYEQAFLAMRALRFPADSMDQQFRRMVFNVMARNQDDHVKNIAFLMDKRGQWSLAPAFDVTYSFNPDGAWTSSHQMTINGKRDGFTRDDLRACGELALLKRGRVDSILSEVQQIVSTWRAFAQSAGVPDAQGRQIEGNLSLAIVP